MSDTIFGRTNEIKILERLFQSKKQSFLLFMEEDV